jgi:hypothetical protein
MKVLSRWKEIANHMRQGERTVKRWEQFGLPVHRVGEAQKGPVFAFVEEVEKWQKTTGTRNADVIQKLQTLASRGQAGQNYRHIPALRIVLDVIRTV